MKIKFIRFDESVKIPVRKNYSDTGADIFMPNGYYVEPGQTVIIPLGFGIEVPNGYNAYIQIRTSLARQGLTIEQCAIDAGYTGQIHMILHNNSNAGFAWYKGDRLGYLVVHPVVYPEFIEDLNPERGTGAFGSTGK